MKKEDRQEIHPFNKGMMERKGFMNRSLLFVFFDRFKSGRTGGYPPCLSITLLCSTTDSSSFSIIISSSSLHSSILSFHLLLLPTDEMCVVHIVGSGETHCVRGIFIRMIPPMQTFRIRRWIIGEKKLHRISEEMRTEPEDQIVSFTLQNRSRAMSLCPCMQNSSSEFVFIHQSMLSVVPPSLQSTEIQSAALESVLETNVGCHFGVVCSRWDRRETETIWE